MVFDNVVDDDGEFIELDLSSYRYKIFDYLKNNFTDFDNYLFCIFSNDDFEIPATRFYPHDKKVLIWISGEKKDQQINEVKEYYHHIFANYYWDEDKVTSIPLGYNYFIDDWNYVPINERSFNFSFVGALNRHRIPMMAELTGINKNLLTLGMYYNSERTLKILNNFLDWKRPSDKFFLTKEFNSGVNCDQYCKTLRQTKIIFAPKGWVNTETYRMYEAMAYGCVVFANELPKRKYYENIPVIRVDDWEIGVKKARELLKNETLLAELSEKNKQFYNDNLSSIATAKIIINALDKT